MVWVFFLHKFAAANFETTSPGATQSNREQERKKRREKKRKDKRCL